MVARLHKYMGAMAAFLPADPLDAAARASGGGIVTDQTKETTAPSDREIARALAWIKTHGDFVRFPCADDEMPALWRAFRERSLVKRGARPISYVLTPAGEAFVEVMKGRESDG